METVCSLKVESGVPTPQGRQALTGKSAMLRDTLRGMKAGESFIWGDCYQLVYRAARQAGVKITTRKVDGEGIRVWRRG